MWCAQLIYLLLSFVLSHPPSPWLFTFSIKLSYYFNYLWTRFYFIWKMNFYCISSIIFPLILVRPFFSFFLYSFSIYSFNLSLKLYCSLTPPSLINSSHINIFFYPCFEITQSFSFSFLSFSYAFTLIITHYAKYYAFMSSNNFLS